MPKNGKEMIPLRVSVEWCNDHKSYGTGYIFRHNKKVIARCDESDYHEFVDMLRSQGYIIND